MKRNALIWTLVSLSMAACSGSTEDETSNDPMFAELTDADLSIEPATIPSDEEMLAFKASLEAEQGFPIMPSDPDEQSFIDGFDAMNVPEPTGLVEKTQTPVVFGWAMDGILGFQSDGLQHSQIVDTDYTSSADFGDDLLGRCGRFDSTVDNSFKPCIIPFGKIGVANGKRRRWFFDWASCGLSAAQAPAQAALQAAAERAFQTVTTGTGFSFPQVTSAASADITLYCSFGEIPAGKIAIGYPFGHVDFSYAADHVFDDRCEEVQPGLGPVPVGGYPNFHALHFADMYYTYTKGKIGINFVDFLNYMLGCSTTTAVVIDMSAKVLAHEIGHVMGFSHQQLPVSGTMFASKSCTWLKQSSQWNVHMSDALNDLHTHTPGQNDTLAIYDEDLSCNSPLGGGEKHIAPVD